MANPDHLKILKKGVAAWNKWREENRFHPDKGPDLSGANLNGMNLKGAELHWVNLSRAILKEANLRGANLNGANLHRANVSGTDLGGAQLADVNFNRADLTKANLFWAIVWRATFRQADLKQANLGKADLSGADFSDADLNGADLRRAWLEKSNFKNANITASNLYATAREGWKTDGIKCQYIYWDEAGKVRTPQGRDFQEDEFAKIYTWFDSVVDLVLNLPYSDFSFYLGSLIANIVNQKAADDSSLIMPKSVEALDNNTTQYKFLHFGENKEALKEIKKSLATIQGSINDNSEELKKRAASVEKPNELIGLRENLPIPFTPFDLKPQNIVKMLNERHTLLPSCLQKALEIIQKCFN